jgi:hypothetical protein
MILDKLITAIFKAEIRNKLNYLTKDYIDSIVEKVITKEVNKLLVDDVLKDKLNKKLDISELIKHSEFRSLSALREYVTKAVNEQFKLETGDYFYQALVKFLNTK